MKGIKYIMYTFLKEIFKRFYITKSNKIIHKKNIFLVLIYICDICAMQETGETSLYLQL